MLMSSRKIQSSFILPDNWLEYVTTYNIYKDKRLSPSQQAIFKCIQDYIIDNANRDKIKNILSISPCIEFIKYIINGKVSWIQRYRKLPLHLAKITLCELKGQKGIEFAKKFISLEVELYACSYFAEQGFSYQDRSIENGACDLIMEKDGKIYNIEVKTKENDDILLSRLYDILEAYSYLKQSEFMQRKIILIEFKDEGGINKYKDLPYMLCDIERFLEEFRNNKTEFEGKMLYISCESRINKNIDIARVEKLHCNSLIRSDFKNIKNIKEKIQKLFFASDRQIVKMNEKSKKFANFIGFLFWNIPFELEPYFENIEQCFYEIKDDIKFNLYVCLYHRLYGEKIFYI